MFTLTDFAGRIALACLLIPGLATHAQEIDKRALATIGARVTEGAAAGYVQDRICATCHKEKYDSYQHVGMAQSFSNAASASRIEAFGREYFHEPSQRYYQITDEDGRLTFRRYQRDAAGAPINSIEMPIAWIMGSGNRARSYIYQTPWGEMFLLPLSWYSESESWAMSPGFEAANHPGLHRQIARECMFCHNAYPEVAAGSDEHFKAEIFPGDLPQGTGCQRCHGPGGAHVSSVLSGNEIDSIRASIVNPARLSQENRDSVCLQCHLLPSATVVGSRQFDRADYSFRPGQNLTDYLVHIDVEERGVAEQDRFEINHHGYRFLQSACYRESEGALTCISCHDPHVKPDSANFRASVGDVCTECHAEPGGLHAATLDTSEQQCVDCHMPARRTRDVVNVTMTDHLIATGPFDFADLVAPREKQNPPIAEISVFDFGVPPTGNDADIHRLVAALRSNRSVDVAASALRTLLRDTDTAALIPQIELATAQFDLGQYESAEMTARRAIAADSNNAAAYKALGVALIGQDKLDGAIENLQQSLEIQRDPEVHFNLAAAYLRQQAVAPAEAQLDAALELRPTLGGAWKFKALILASRGQNQLARDALIRAIELEPTDFAAYNDLINLLRRMGEAAEANRYIELGTRLSEALSR